MIYFSFGEMNYFIIGMHLFPFQFQQFQDFITQKSGNKKNRRS